MNSTEINEFVRARRTLFWSISDTQLDHVSIPLIVETILTYGSLKDIKQLFGLVGLEKVAEIFFEQLARRRVNYPPRTAHYFKLYFNRHVHRHPAA